MPLFFFTDACCIKDGVGVPRGLTPWHATTIQTITWSTLRDRASQTRSHGLEGSTATQAQDGFHSDTPRAGTSCAIFSGFPPASRLQDTIPPPRHHPRSTTTAAAAPNSIILIPRKNFILQIHATRRRIGRRGRLPATGAGRPNSTDRGGLPAMRAMPVHRRA